ncbi:MAG: SMP-30/gluconolactonase/LRE family protein, partial [Ilumatobacteraceae bacterium]
IEGRDTIERRPGTVSIVLPTTLGQPLLGLADAVRVADSTWHVPLDLVPTERLNDGKVGPDGELYVGTTLSAGQPDRARMFRIGADGSAKVILTGLSVSNGLDWFDDGDMAYVDSLRRRISLIKFDDGSPVRWETIVDCDPTWGLPDGLTLDDQENIWVAFYGGSAVRCFDRRGRQLEHVELPVSQPTCPAFGGPELRTLFVTSASDRLSPAALDSEPAAGAVLAIDTGARGRLPNVFSVAD